MREAGRVLYRETVFHKELRIIYNKFVFNMLGQVRTLIVINSMINDALFDIGEKDSKLLKQIALGNRSLAFSNVETSQFYR